MDKLLVFNNWMNQGIKLIRHSNLIPLYGRLEDFEPHPISKMERWLFLPNLDREEYEKTKNKSLLIPIKNSDIDSIEPQINPKIFT